MLEAFSLQPQPNFPKEDILDSNVAIVSRLLRDEMLIETFHENAEKMTILYRLAHEALRQIGSNGDFSLDFYVGLSHGAACYETASQALMADNSHELAKIYQTVAPLHKLTDSARNSIDIMIDARDDLLAKQPRLAAVIGEIDTVYTVPATYATKEAILFGAAVERRIEMDVLDED